MVDDDNDTPPTTPPTNRPPVLSAWRTRPPRSSREWLKADQFTRPPQNLKRWLQANCLTQTHFATGVGCKQSMISRLCKGGRHARGKLARRIEHYTGLPHDLFLDLGTRKRKRGSR